MVAQRAAIFDFQIQGDEEETRCKVMARSVLLLLRFLNYFVSMCVSAWWRGSGGGRAVYVCLCVSVLGGGGGSLVLVLYWCCLPVVLGEGGVGDVMCVAVV